MKEFSKKWNKSKNPKKQRKYRRNASQHLRKNMMSAHLSDALKKRYNRRSIGVRTGDTVKVMRGDFKGRSGKVLDVNRDDYRITIEDVKKTQSSGKDVNIFIPVSNVKIMELDTDDKKRLSKLREKQESK